MSHQPSQHLPFRRAGASGLDLPVFSRVDAVLLGDSPSLGSVAGSPPQGLDPPMLFANLAAGTAGIGFVATSSSTYNHPYNLARRYLSFDHLTGGRGAVNVVTSFAPDAAANFGLEQPLAKEERCRRANEFLEVVTRLWDAWDADAVIADRASGRWGDPAKVHAIDYHGEFFDVRGPLSIPPPPQGRPVIVQAGGSEGGLDLAGRFADAVFTVAQTKDRAVSFRNEIRRRAASAGRHPDSVKISLGVVVITDETDSKARARDFENFARYVVPILQRRGLFHDDYPGPTLRENYGLPWPEQVARPTVTNGARHA